MLRCGSWAIGYSGDFRGTACSALAAFCSTGRTSSTDKSGFSRKALAYCRGVAAHLDASAWLYLRTSACIFLYLRLESCFATLPTQWMRCNPESVPRLWPRAGHLRHARNAGRVTFFRAPCITSLARGATSTVMALLRHTERDVSRVPATRVAGTLHPRIATRTGWIG